MKITKNTWSLFRERVLKKERAAKMEESKVQNMTKFEFIGLMKKMVGDLREANEPINTGKVYMLADMLETAINLIEVAQEEFDYSFYKGVVESLLSKNVSIFMDGDVRDTTVLVLDTDKVRKFQSDKAEEMQWLKA